jgi:hypothetical protein
MLCPFDRTSMQGSCRNFRSQERPFSARAMRRYDERRGARLAHAQSLRRKTRVN